MPNADGFSTTGSTSIPFSRSALDAISKFEISKIRIFENFIPKKLIVRSFLAGHGGFALVWPEHNIRQLTLFGHHVLKMEILIDGFAAAARHAGNLTITGHRSMVTPAQLIIAARIASIMMVVLVMRAHAFVIVVCARFVNLIARVCTALLVRMPGVLTMQVAGLKALIPMRGGPFFSRKLLGHPSLLQRLLYSR